MNPTETNALQLAELAPLAERKQKVLLRECRVHEKLLDKLERAIDRLLADPAEKMAPADIGRLLDFGIKLGRLNANMATEHVEHEHAWSQYHDPVYLAEIDREIEKVFGKCIDVNAESVPHGVPASAGKPVSESHDSQIAENGMPVSPRAASRNCGIGENDDPKLGQGEGQAITPGTGSHNDTSN